MIYALLGSLLWLFVPWTYDTFVRPKMLAVALVVLAYNLLMDKATRIRTKVDPWAAAFAATYLLSLCLSLSKPTSLLGDPRMMKHGLLQIFLYWQCFRIGLRYQDESAGEAVVTMAMPLCAYAFMQRVGFDFYHLFQIPAGRAVSTIGSPVYLASILILVAPLCFLYRPKITVPIVLLAAWAAGTRSVWVGLGMAGIYFYGRKRPWLVLGCVAGAMVAVWLGKRPSSFLSDMERVKTWKFALEAWRIHPWLGWGPDNFYEAFRRVRTMDFINLLNNDKIVQGEAHNLLFQSLVTIGLIGTGALAGLLASIFRNLEDDAMSMAVAAGAFGLLCQGMMEPIAFTPMAAAAFLMGLVTQREEPDVADWYYGERSYALAAAVAAVACAMIVAADGFFSYGQYLLVEKKADPSSAYQRMAVMDPFNIEHMAEYCVSLFKRGFSGDRHAFIKAYGVAWFEAATHPDDPLAHQVYADASSFLVDLDTARREIAIASQLDPVFPIIQRRKKEIDSMRVVVLPQK